MLGAAGVPLGSLLPPWTKSPTRRFTTLEETETAACSHHTPRTVYTSLTTAIQISAMASTAAQDEFDALFESSYAAARSHPEDIGNQTPDHSDSEPSEEPSADRLYEKDGDAQDDAAASNMRSAYYIPKLRSEANTGPKGVIADAQAFEQAKKQARFSFSRKGRASPSPPAAVPRAYLSDDYEKSSEEEDDDGFMARWRQRRLQELANKRFSRGLSPNNGNKRVWGTLVRVDAEGYLDAIETAPADTVVVVFIYDPQVSYSLRCPRKAADNRLLSLRSAIWLKSAFVTSPNHAKPHDSYN